MISRVGRGKGNRPTHTHALMVWEVEGGGGCLEALGGGEGGWGGGGGGRW